MVGQFIFSTSETAGFTGVSLALQDGEVFKSCVLKKCLDGRTTKQTNRQTDIVCFSVPFFPPLLIGQIKIEAQIQTLYCTPVVLKIV